jgi:hypothetical protein
MNIFELMTRLDPSYQGKVSLLREQMSMTAYTEKFKAQEAMRREEFKARNDFDQERLRANEAMKREEFRASSAITQEHLKAGEAMKREEFKATETMNRERFRAEVSTAQEQFKAQEAMKRENLKADEAMKREVYKAQQEDGRLTKRYQLESQLEQKTHENRLMQMEEQLKLSIVQAGFQSMLELVHKSAEEDNKKRDSLHRQLETRTQLRSEVFKMLAGAVIQEKLAQKQHRRDQEARTWGLFEGFLIKTYEAQGEEAVKREIDRVCQEWDLTG